MRAHYVTLCRLTCASEAFPLCNDGSVTLAPNDEFSAFLASAATPLLSSPLSRLAVVSVSPVLLLAWARVEDEEGEEGGGTAVVLAK